MVYSKQVNVRNLASSVVSQGSPGAQKDQKCNDGVKVLNFSKYDPTSVASQR